jgi:hypothetical protein
MAKWIVAAAMMMTAAFAGTSSAPSPTQDAADEVATGTCSYSCSSNGKTYINRTQCLAACGGGVCVVEAC